MKSKVSAFWKRDRALAAVGLASLAVFAATLVGLFVDSRVIAGAPAWLKPAKFALSISIYCFTFLWLLGYVEGRQRTKRWIGGIVAYGLALELAIIGLQAARGTTSHFNNTTPLDTLLVSVMGVTIVFVFLATLVLAALLLRARLSDPVFATGLRLGLLVAIVGLALGGLMLGPTPGLGAEFGGRPPSGISGAHTVGAPDGGPGLPLVNWSTHAGDLRVGHFVGMHALQLLPLLAWLINRRFPWLSVGRRVALVWTAGLGHLGLTALVTWQALRGQPLVRPDALTLTVLALLLGAVALALVAIVGSRRRVGAYASARTARNTASTSSRVLSSPGASRA